MVLPERSNLRQDDSEFTGKYESSGQLGQFLVSRFFGAIAQVLRPGLGQISSVLEIGCGAGYSTNHLKNVVYPRHFIASDVSTSLLRRAQQFNPEVPLLQQSVYSLAHADNSFDLLVMLEVLEHLEDPDRALLELRRVARSFVVLSTPREPLWRTLNFLRGKYWSDLGNTPGHVQHWSKRGLIEKVSQHFEVVSTASPIPWTILLLAPRQ